MVTKTKTRLGNQRPTQSVTLHYVESLAHEAIELYQKQVVIVTLGRLICLRISWELITMAFGCIRSTVMLFLGETERLRMSIFLSCGHYTMD